MIKHMISLIIIAAILLSPAFVHGGALDEQQQESTVIYLHIMRNKLYNDLIWMRRQMAINPGDEILQQDLKDLVELIELVETKLKLNEE